MKLIPEYDPEKYPVLSKYGIHRVVGNRSKNYPDKNEFFREWLNKTYPHQYKDVKEGDYFIVWNGSYTPVPFVQLKDERPDKWNRPTRLLDGAYYGFSPDRRVVIVPKEIVVQLKREILKREL